MTVVSVVAEIMKSQPVGTLVGLVAIGIVLAMRIRPGERTDHRKRSN